MRMRMRMRMRACGCGCGCDLFVCPVTINSNSKAFNIHVVIERFMYKPCWQHVPRPFYLIIPSCSL